MTERAMFKGVINLIIKQDDKVLLFFRNDGFFNYDGGWWVLPAGHIEQGETARDAAIREAKEELDKLSKSIEELESQNREYGEYLEENKQEYYNNSKIIDNQKHFPV